MQKEWPGNTRELENTIRGWSAMTLEPTITSEHIPANPPKRSPDPEAMDLGQSYKNLKKKVIEDFTMGYLYRLLKHTHGNVSLAAQISGIKRQSLQKIIKRYGVQVDQYRN
jgi:DNA-binding NtrC family response regulator